MIKEHQIYFYKEVGRRLTAARKRRNMTVYQLEKLCGEQHKTIRSIEEGRPCSLHHLVWMQNIFNINFSEIFVNMEDKRGDKNEEGINSLEELI